MWWWFLIAIATVILLLLLTRNRKKNTTPAILSTGKKSLPETFYVWNPADRPSLPERTYRFVQRESPSTTAAAVPVPIPVPPEPPAPSPIRQRFRTDSIPQDKIQIPQPPPPIELAWVSDKKLSSASPAPTSAPSPPSPPSPKKITVVSPIHVRSLQNPLFSASFIPPNNSRASSLILDSSHVPAPAPAPAPAPVSYVSDLSPSQEPQMKAIAFTIVCYNIRIDIDKYPHDWKSRSGHVYANIMQFKPSVICMQEASPKTVDFFGIQLPTYENIGSGRAANSEESVPIMVDTRIWKIVRSGTMLLTERGPFPCREGAPCKGITKFGGIVSKHPRIFSWVIIRGSKTRELLVVNTHFPVESALQAFCAAELIQWMNSSDRPATQIICGDFNAHDKKSVVMFQKAGFLCSMGFTNQSTFGTYGMIDDTSARLDYILFRPSHRTHLIVQNSGISDYTYGGHRPSDHSLLHSSFILA